MTAPIPRPGILKIKPYVGGDTHIEGHEHVIKLASNESALGPSPKAIAAYQSIEDQLHRYPDGSATNLRKTIGETHGLNPEQIVCGNGSDELLDMLARAYAGPGDEILYSQYGFLVYRISASGVGATPIAAPECGYRASVDALIRLASEKTRVVYIANPNNPTGTYLSEDDLIQLRKGLPDASILVIDSAYAEFVSNVDYSSGMELVDRYKSIVMTRTFSKAYGLAALRLGWAYCPPNIVDVLNRIRQPFNVTAQAQAAGSAALADVEHLNAARTHNDLWSTKLRNGLDKIGLYTVPSAANFLLTQFSSPKAAENANRHLRRDGIIVREMGAYHLSNCLRITVGKEEENIRLLQSLSRYSTETG